MGPLAKNPKAWNNRAGIAEHVRNMTTLNFRLTT
jgi:hypothetical protein